MTKLFMFRASIHKLAHPLAVAASGLFMAALTILPMTRVPTARAQPVRCPCFNEMLIVGACGRSSCLIELADPFLTLDCPKEGFDSGDPVGWKFRLKFTSNGWKGGD